jgi:HK97 family phage prohead protease
LFSAVLIKSVNEDAREFEGIASTPTPDRVKDTINPLGLSYPDEVPLLLNHKSDQPVGTVRFGKATKSGLPFKAKIPKLDEEGTVKQRTDEAWHSVKSGIVKGTSIGFIPQEYNYKDDGGIHFEKAAVQELSLTAIPCNPEAMITAFKSLQTSEAAQAAEVPGETPEKTAPEGNAEGGQADPSTDAATVEKANAAPRATLKPFFYPKY